jgi:hypothetical protein
MFSIIDAQKKKSFSINRQEKSLAFLSVTAGEHAITKKNNFFSKTAAAWKLLEKEIFIMNNRFSEII